MQPRRLLFAVLGVIGLLAPPHLLAADRGTAEPACVKTVRWEGNQAPLNLVGRDGRPRGYYLDLTRQILRRMGCVAQPLEMRWARGLRELQAGRLDISPGLFQTPERERYAWFTQGIHVNANRLYLSGEARRRYPGVRALADLRNTDLVIGVETGARYGGDYDAMLDDARFLGRLHVIPGNPTGWRMLASGRVDGLISDDLRARVIGIPMQPADDPAEAVLTVSEQPVRVALSRASVDGEFARRFDVEVGRMLGDGSVARLREGYERCFQRPDSAGCEGNLPVDPEAESTAVSISPR